MWAKYLSMADYPPNLTSLVCMWRHLMELHSASCLLCCMSTGYSIARKGGCKDLLAWRFITSYCTSRNLCHRSSLRHVSPFVKVSTVKRKAFISAPAHVASGCICRSCVFHLYSCKQWVLLHLHICI